MIVLFDHIDDAGVALEPGLAPVPIEDIDRAKSFYVDELGFEEETDVAPGDGVRIVRLATRGSSGSILLAARERPA